MNNQTNQERKITQRAYNNIDSLIRETKLKISFKKKDDRFFNFIIEDNINFIKFEIKDINKLLMPSFYKLYKKNQDTACDISKTDVYISILQDLKVILNSKETIDKNDNETKFFIEHGNSESDSKVLESVINDINSISESIIEQIGHYKLANFKFTYIAELEEKLI